MKLTAFIVATMALALATPAAATCDRQALETARTLTLLRDHQALWLHLRSYCDDLPVFPCTSPAGFARNLSSAASSQVMFALFMAGE